MKHFIIFLLAINSFSCSEDDTAFDPDATYISIENTSDFTYTSVRINTTGGENFYGTLAPGHKSTYKAFEFAYRYAFVELLIDGDTATILPFDYVGEKLLDPGKYTYQIDAIEGDSRFGRLSIMLKEN